MMKRLIMVGWCGWWAVDSFSVHRLRARCNGLRLRMSSCDTASCARAESVKSYFALSSQIITFFVPQSPHRYERKC